MIKILGMVSLIISGYLGGRYAAFKLSKKVRFIEEYMEFIKIVQNDIRYNQNYLQDIIKNHRGDGPFCSYLNKCYKYISSGEPFPQAWIKTFSNVASEISISGNLANIINSFGLGLGSSDTEGQISHCRYNYSLMGPYLQSAIEERKSHGKLYSVLGTCLGTAAALFSI